jgi:hypothetical protein
MKRLVLKTKASKIQEDEEEDQIEDIDLEDLEEPIKESTKEEQL